MDFSQEVFDKIVEDYRAMQRRFGLKFLHVTFIPISAKMGDNVVSRSERMPWYAGPALLEFLETVELPAEADDRMRLPVQYVIRPISSRFPDFRGYAGLIAEGAVRVGDRVRVYPSESVSTVTGIYLGDKALESAVADQSICLTLADDIDISRGDVIVSGDGVQPGVGQDFAVDVCWFRNSPLVCGRRYTIRHATQEVVGIVKEIEYKVDVNTQEKIYDVEQLTMNDIARVYLKTAAPLVWDPYRENRTMGSLIFIDASNDTVGAGMIASEY